MDKSEGGLSGKVRAIWARTKLVPEAGIEPARPQWPADFKSAASTNSATRAMHD